MLKEEFLQDGKLVNHYSDDGHYIIQNETGIKYNGAIDVVPCRYTYTESDELIEIAEETVDA